MADTIYKLRRNDVEGALVLAEKAIKRKTYDSGYAHELLMLQDDDEKILLTGKLQELLTRYQYKSKK
jgi:hypothetical protein